MGYHLHRQGTTLGPFPLEELRRRREAGEIAGTDLVWCQGMANWAPLDAVLGSGNPSSAAPLPAATEPASAPKSNRGLVWGLVAGGVVVLTGLGLMGFVAIKLSRQVREALQTASASDAADIADQPVTTTTNTLTAADARRRGREFRVRQYIEAYRKHGPHSASWDRDAALLLESWIASNHGGPTNLPSPRELSDKLAALPDCEDPLVLTAAALNAVEVHEKIRRLERALAVFDKSSYAAYPKLFAAVSLAAETEVRSSQLHALDQRALDYLKQAFTDGSFQPADEPELGEIFVHGWAAKFLGRHGPSISRIVEQAKGYDWLARVLQGEQHITAAWKARGSGTSDTVSGAGWQGFSEHLSQARTALTEAWNLHTNRPLPAARMIAVAMGDAGAEEMRTWFDRAIQAQIDYPEAWASFRWGLRPRWHGSHEALLALGIQAVNTKRFDTDVPRKLIDCISDLEEELKVRPGEHLYGRSDIWPHVKEMYEGYVAEPTEAAHQRGWRSVYAVVAYLAGENGVARRQLEAVDWKPTRESLTGWGADLALLPQQVAALTGNAAEEVGRAESRYRQGDLATPIQLYTELSASTQADEMTRTYSRTRLLALKQEERLAKGEWLEFLPESGTDPNWEFGDDKVRRLADNSIEVESGTRGHAFYCHTRVGPAFEITGEFDVVRSSNQEFQAGVVLGIPDAMDSEWYSFRMKRNSVDGQIASFARGFSLRQVSHPATLKERGNTFRFCLEDGKADAWVNGTQVWRQMAPERPLRVYHNCVVGLGAYNDMNQTVICYRNVKLHRLATSDSQE